MAESDVREQPVARVYAEALLELAVQRDQVDTVREELTALAGLMRADPKLHAFMQSVVIDDDARGESINRMFKGRVSETMFGFLRVLNAKGRAGLLDAIAEQFAAVEDKRLGRIDVGVTSACELDEPLRAEILRAVQQHTGKTPVLDVTVDPELIGGLRIRIGDRLLDGSVRSRLAGVAKALKRRGSHEIAAGREFVARQGETQ